MSILGGTSLAEAGCASGAGTVRRLYVDVSVIARRDAGTGIQRVVRGLYGQLMQDGAGPEFEVVPVFGTRWGGYRVRTGTEPQGAAIVPRAGDVFLGLDLAAHIITYHEDLLADWRRAGMSIMFVVYDLLPVTQPQWFRRHMRRHFARWLGVVARQADAVACISEAVADEYRAWLSSCPHLGRKCDLNGTGAVVSIRLGHDFDQAAGSTGVPSDAASIVAWMREVPTVLMVGTIEPRKGYDVALRAFEYIWSQQSDALLRLVIVGRPGWKTDALQARMTAEERRRADAFRWLANVSDEFLGLLYGAAAGVLVCSHAEGYGLPLVEALGRDLSVLARDIPVFREVGGAAITYFDDDAPAALASKITAAFTSRDSQASRGISDLHSWRDSLDDLRAIVNALPCREASTTVMPHWLRQFWLALR